MTKNTMFIIFHQNRYEIKPIALFFPHRDLLQKENLGRNYSLLCRLGDIEQGFLTRCWLFTVAGMLTLSSLMNHRLVLEVLPVFALAGYDVAHQIGYFKSSGQFEFCCRPSLFELRPAHQIEDLACSELFNLMRSHSSVG